MISDDLVPDRRGTVSFLSSVKREGDWILPRNYRALTVMGSLELDLTRARIGSGTTLIELVSVMGSVSVVVPPDLRLECEGDPFVGSFEVTRNTPSTTSPDAPLVRIKGSAVLGSVEIKVIDPNAPGWFEKLRARLSPGADRKSQIANR